MSLYLHPSVSATIVDDQVTFLSATGLTNLFSVFEAEKGESKLKYVTSDPEYIFNYGQPNYFKYGQAGYNNRRWVQNQGGVWAYRITPDNAKYANIILGVRLSAVGDKVKVTNYKTFKATTIANAVNIDNSTTLANFDISDLSLVAGVDALVSDANGVSLDIVRFTSKGKGTYANNLGVRLYPTDAFSETYGFQVYVADVTETIASGEIINRESFFVALEEDALDTNKNSMFVTDVFNSYSQYLNAIVNTNNLVSLYTKLAGYNTSNGDAPLDITFSTSEFITDLNAYLTANASSSGPVDEDFDGISVALNNQETVGFTVVNASADYINFNSNESVKLLDGNDGTWASPAAKDTAYVNAFTGIEPVSGEDSGIKSILATLEVEVDVVLDANFSDAVRQGIITLAKSRQDHIACIDMGNGIASVSASLAKRSTGPAHQESSELISYWTQYFKVADLNSGKLIQVTPTYFLASIIPSNDQSFGIQKNFVGPRRGIITGFDELSWNPNDPEKTELYKRQINYVERDTESTIFITQMTSKKQITPLSDINHVRALLRMKRSAIRIARNFRMEDATPFIYGQLETAIRNDISSFLENGALQNLTVSVYASKYDREQKIARVRIDVVFTDTIERIAITFNVNR